MLYVAAAGSETGGAVMSCRMSFTVESMAWSTAATTGGGPARITSLRASLTVTTRLSASSAACDQLVMDWNGKFPSVPLAPESFTPLRETTTVADVVSLPVLSRTRSPSNDCEGEVIYPVERRSRFREVRLRCLEDHRASVAPSPLCSDAPPSGARAA